MGRGGEEGRERKEVMEEESGDDRGNGRDGTEHGMGREGRRGGEGLHLPNFNSWRRQCTELPLFVRRLNKATVPLYGVHQRWKLCQLV